MRFLMLAFYLLVSQLTFSQHKAVVDTSILNKWPYVSPSGIKLSNDGQYVSYILYHHPAGQQSLVMQEPFGKWTKTIVGDKLKIVGFSTDSRNFFWQNEDSLFFLQNGRNEVKLLGISSSISLPSKAQGNWLALPVGGELLLVNMLTGKKYRFIGVRRHSWSPDGEKIAIEIQGVNNTIDLTVLRLSTGGELRFHAIKEFFWATQGKAMVIISGQSEGLQQLYRMQWVPFDGGQTITCWQGVADEVPLHFAFDNVGMQMAFCVQKKQNGVQVNSIWHYRAETPVAELRVQDSSPGIQQGWTLSGNSSFSGNGRWLSFVMQRLTKPLQHHLSVTPVDIWSYRDNLIYPAQQKAGREKPVIREISRGFMASNGGKVIQLEEGSSQASEIRGNYVLISKGGKAADPLIIPWWQHSETRLDWLLSLQDGKWLLLPQREPKVTFPGYSFSPTGRWLYYWDADAGCYFSIDPKTGRTVNLTGNLPQPVANEWVQEAEEEPVGIAGWYADDDAVLVYDNYDIWKLDPSGRLPAVNITGGYGQRHRVKLRLVENLQEPLQGKEELLLTGLNAETKYNGFFRLKLAGAGEPLELLTMGPYTYYQLQSQQGFKNTLGNGMCPLQGKKGKKSRWVVLRHNSEEYPNFYITEDLKSFTMLTDLQPQRRVNWLRAELVRWKMLNGQVSHGVLYKPEDFDSTKKYPIIFNYYQKLSHQLNQFPFPRLTTDNINIPWFVSRGYLVFTPDIHYTVASRLGGMTVIEAAYNAVLSAARYLIQLTYVDSTRMGIQGHSLGGLETNGIITQSSKFAAAAEMAGYSDAISAYLGLGTFEDGGQLEYAHGIDKLNHRMGATPWERPDVYKRGSPIRNADKVSTPLLITHNQKDGSVNVRQGIEMYMALRRLGKPCWMLQYPNSGHVLRDSKEALDYTIRLTQFFDHYLKGAPAPQWMTMNTLAAYRNTNALYGYDLLGNCKKDCKICGEWNTKITIDSLAVIREIENRKVVEHW